MAEKQHILVLKGWEGFADRLQVLTDSIHYCVVNRATICVDWRDYMWGQSEMDFSDYFDIIGLQTIPLSEVVDKLKGGATITPPVWTPELLASRPTESIHYENFNVKFEKYNKFDSDIVVINGKGLRTWHVDHLINNIKIKDSLVPSIVEKLSELRLPYTAIHLRGTDRLTDDSLRSIYTEYESLAPHLKARVFVISDMKEILQEWMKQYPDSLVIDKDPCVLKLPSTKLATHMYEGEALEFYGVTKHELNLNTITDFLVLAFANTTYGNKQSVFTGMGKVMRQGGVDGVAKWLGGFIPQRLPLQNNKGTL
jgi:hypothetical protein